MYLKYVAGIQFLDEKDNEIAKYDSLSSGDWSEAKTLPEGFEIIGIYGNTTKPYDDIQFGFLLWNLYGIYYTNISSDQLIKAATNLESAEELTALKGCLED